MKGIQVRPLVVFVAGTCIAMPQYWQGLQLDYIYGSAASIASHHVESWTQGWHTLTDKEQYRSHCSRKEQAHTLDTHGSELSQSLPLPDRAAPGNGVADGQVAGAAVLVVVAAGGCLRTKTQQSSAVQPLLCSILASLDVDEPEPTCSR